MDRRLDELERKFEDLRQEVETLRRRVDLLIGTADERPRARGPSAPTPSPPAPAAAAAPSADRAAILPLAGRTMMVMAGAYLLRAVTDAGYVPPVVGACMGLAYAVAWLVLGDRSGARGQRWSALFHGLAAALIAFPLLWETTVRFRLFPPAVGAALLVAMLAGSLLLAVRRELFEIAWVSVLFALATGVALMQGTHDLLPTTFALLGVAAVTEWTAFRDRWPLLRWPVGLVVDASLLLAIIIVTRGDGLPEGYAPVGLLPMLGVLLALPVIYVVSIGARNLARLRDATPFEIGQTVLALLLGFGGAARLLGLQGGGGGFLGALSTGLGLGCYAAAFRFVDRRQGHQRNFFFYSTLGGVLVLVGTALIAGTSGYLGLTWALLGLTILGVGWRFDRFTLRFHGALAMSAAAASAGVLAASAAALAGTPEAALPPPPATSYAVVAAILAGYALLVLGRHDRETRLWVRRVPSVLVSAVLCWSLAGLLADTFTRLLAGAPPDRDVAIVASVRTGVLSLLAILSGGLGHRLRLRSIAWLSYPLLVLGGISLALQDFRLGRPVTLFISFAVYGAAMILAPRIGRGGEPTPPE
jgi:hypothetical protein